MFYSQLLGCTTLVLLTPPTTLLGSAQGKSHRGTTPSSYGGVSVCTGMVTKRRGFLMGVRYQKIQHLRSQNVPVITWHLLADDLNLCQICWPWLILKDFSGNSARDNCIYIVPICTQYLIHHFTLYRGKKTLLYSLSLLHSVMYFFQLAFLPFT